MEKVYLKENWREWGSNLGRKFWKVLSENIEKGKKIEGEIGTYEYKTDDWEYYGGSEIRSIRVW